MSLELRCISSQSGATFRVPQAPGPNKKQNQAFKSEYVPITEGVKYKILSPEELKTVHERLKATNTLASTERNPYRKSELDRDYKAIFAGELEHNAALFKKECRDLRGRLEREKKNGDHDRKRLTNDINNMTSKMALKNNSINFLENEKDKLEKRNLDLSVQLESKIEEVNSLKRKGGVLEKELDHKRAKIGDLEAFILEQAEKHTQNLKLKEKELASLKHRGEGLGNEVAAQKIKIFDLDAIITEQVEKINAIQKEKSMLQEKFEQMQRSLEIAELQILQKSKLVGDFFIQYNQLPTREKIESEF